MTLTAVLLIPTSLALDFKLPPALDNSFIPSLISFSNSTLLAESPSLTAFLSSTNLLVKLEYCLLNLDSSSLISFETADTIEPLTSPKAFLPKEVKASLIALVKVLFKVSNFSAEALVGALYTCDWLSLFVILISKVVFAKVLSSRYFLFETVLFFISTLFFIC